MIAYTCTKCFGRYTKDELRDHPCEPRSRKEMLDAPDIGRQLPGYAQDPKPSRYDPAEQDDVLKIFTELLRVVTADGGRKRALGAKPSWKVDPTHEAAMWSHVNKWKHGLHQDADSGVHPLVHLAWRALAIAWQETEAAR